VAPGALQAGVFADASGFDHQYGHYNGAIDYFTHIRDGGFDWHRDDHVSRDEGYSTFLVAKEAVRLIDTHDMSKPLFLYVPFNAVHAPHQVPEKYEEGYTNLTGQRKIYAGMCAAMDEAIGTILDAIDRKGMRKDTLIIFSSDNGGPNPGKVTSNVPLRAGKTTLYEGGVRVCAAACWDGHIPAGGRGESADPHGGLVPDDPEAGGRVAGSAEAAAGRAGRVGGGGGGEADAARVHPAQRVADERGRSARGIGSWC